MNEIPSRAQVRTLLKQSLKSDAEILEFYIDHYPELLEHISPCMNHIMKFNVLLEHVDPSSLKDEIIRYNRNRTVAAGHIQKLCRKRDGCARPDARRQPTTVKAPESQRQASKCVKALKSEQALTELVARLKQKIAELVLELDMLKAALRRPPERP